VRKGSKNWERRRQSRFAAKFSSSNVQSVVRHKQTGTQVKRKGVERPHCSLRNKGIGRGGRLFVVY